MSTAPIPTASEGNNHFNAEAAIEVATDFLKKLGYKRDLFPRKAVLSEKVYIIEIAIEKQNAKVQIDSQTKTVTEFEIQKAEEEQSSAFPIGKKKMLIIIVAVVMTVALVVGLKILSVF